LEADIAIHDKMAFRSWVFGGPTMGIELGLGGGRSIREGGAVYRGIYGDSPGKLQSSIDFMPYLTAIEA
jgi:hypothetical protein